MLNQREEIKGSANYSDKKKDYVNIPVFVRPVNANGSHF